MAHKYKGRPRDWFLGAILILVGATAFGLGRLSTLQGERQGLLIRLPDGTTQSAAAYQASAPAAAAAAPAQAAAETGAFVASKSGSKYYLASCSGASRIKEENKVWFATAAEAAAAGYAPASNCPGL